MTTHTPSPAGYGRADQYPEHLVGSGNYRDTGCSLAPSCLACPLPACRYDVPQNWEKQERNVRIVARREAGATVTTIVAEFGVSLRTVARVMQKARTK